MKEINSVKMSSHLDQVEASISPHHPAILITNPDQMSGRKVEPWEMAFFNGGAIMDEIPVSSRDLHDQIAFRDGSTSNSTNQIDKAGPQINNNSSDDQVFDVKINTFAYLNSNWYSAVLLIYVKYCVVIKYIVVVVVVVYD
jgi:hypothetical protein